MVFRKTYILCRYYWRIKMWDRKAERIEKYLKKKNKSKAKEQRQVTKGNKGKRNKDDNR